MDLPILIGIAVALLTVILTALFFARQRSPADAASDDKPRAAPQRLQQRDGDAAPLSRAQMARNQRNRARAAAAAAASAAAEEEAASHPAAADSADDDDDDRSRRQLPGAEKIGAKKRAKLEAKAARAVQRETELEQREERRARDELQAAERRRQDEAERAAEQQREREEREAREQQERREQLEYERMRAAFSVEEEGFDEESAGGDDEAQNRLQQFVDHIRRQKSVQLDELAREFRLKTQQCIERIQELKANGTLTGVLDDRGKFIYVSEAELQAVAEFIRQRGRVSIGELAECSNRLVSLSPADAPE